MALHPVRSRAFLLLFACTGLLGCAVVDQYSGRATVYNAEAEEAHNQGLLLNIVRASLRHPRRPERQRSPGSPSAHAKALTAGFGDTAVANPSSGTVSLRARATLLKYGSYKPVTKGLCHKSQFPGRTALQGLRNTNNFLEVVDRTLYATSPAREAC